MMENKAWKFCDNCQQWRYLITVNERTFCEVCHCAPGQKDDAGPFTPSCREERDWRILRWAARQDRSDTAPAYFLDTIAALTAGLVGPTEAEAKL
jgi:hypothetical protein